MSRSVLAAVTMAGLCAAASPQALARDVSPTLRLGGNYTFIERDYDFASAATGIEAGAETDNQRAAASAMKVEGVPRHQAFVYLAWKATDKLTLTPSLEIASNRIAMVTSCRTTLTPAGGADACPARVEPSIRLPNFVAIGAHALVNFEAEYAFNDNASMNVGVTNLFDKNYALAEGFPEPGRQVHANARVRF